MMQTSGVERYKTKNEISKKIGKLRENKSLTEAEFRQISEQIIFREALRSIYPERPDAVHLSEHE